jgi:hypothetical protein
MRFTTARYRQKYTVTPTVRELAVMGGGIPRRDYVGLTLDSGNTRILDTEQQAMQDGWTEEDRLMMERHILSHPEFGMSRMADSNTQQGDDLINHRVWELWFAPDQEIPPEHLEFCKTQRWYTAWDVENDLQNTVPEISENTCIEAPLVDGVIYRCTKPAVEGSDYCEVHNREV